MKTLYIECNMGAAGDMLSAALLELHCNKEDFIARINAIGIPNTKIINEPSTKCGIVGTHMKVLANGIEENEHMHEHEHEHTHEHEHMHEHEHEHEHTHEHTHHHTGMHNITELVSTFNVSDKIKKDILGVYKLIAEAESKVHGCEIEQIHFHEVGTLDAIADIASVCMLIDELAPNKICASPVCVGSGTVKCAHGILPVPAPATSYLLKDIPIYAGNILGELCTPTGAALLKYFVNEFAPIPMMKIDKIGYGMGTKDFEAANCLRAIIGNTEDEQDTVVELLCNLDDMTGEQIAFATEKLFEAGALDVFTQAIGMKKGRTGVLLTCMCRSEQREKMLKLIFLHTSTIGIREYISKRYTLKREITNVNTNFGEVHAKKSFGYGVCKIKPEYDDLRAIADKNNISISDIKIDK